MVCEQVYVRVVSNKMVANYLLEYYTTISKAKPKTFDCRVQNGTATTVWNYHSNKF